MAARSEEIPVELLNWPYPDSDSVGWCPVTVLSRVNTHGWSGKDSKETWIHRNAAQLTIPRLRHTRDARSSVESADGVERVSNCRWVGNLIHRKEVFCISRCRSIWVWISAIFRDSVYFGEMKKFQSKWSKATCGSRSHCCLALLCLADVVSPLHCTRGYTYLSLLS